MPKLTCPECGKHINLIEKDKLGQIIGYDLQKFGFFDKVDCKILPKYCPLCGTQIEIINQERVCMKCNKRYVKI